MDEPPVPTAVRKIALKKRADGEKSPAPIVVIHRPAQTDGSAPKTELDLATENLALLIHNSVTSCWLSSTDREHTYSDSFSTLTAALDKHDEFQVTVKEDAVSINGTLFHPSGAIQKIFVRQLASASVSNFTLLKGMTADEFVRFVDIACRKPEAMSESGGFYAAVVAANFTHIKSRKIVLQEVDEHELVVEKRDVDAEMIEEKRQAEVDALAYLSAEDVIPSVESAIKLALAARDAEHMSGIVAEAASRRCASAPESSRRPLAEVIADCLQRLYDGLMENPASKTQKGKKSIERAFTQLETHLTTKVGGADAADIVRVISNTVERLTESLQVENIADEYVKKLKALEASEKRILRFIKHQGLEQMRNSELEKKLGDGGLDVSGWHRLLAASGADSATDGAESALDSAAAITQLASLLSRLETDIHEEKESPEKKADQNEKIASDIREIGAGIQTVVDGTRRKIRDLVQSVTEDIERVDIQEQMEKAAGSGPKMTRKQMVVILAEIVQELCQPLSVVQSTLDMTVGGMLGTLSPTQMEMLKLAAEGAVRMKTLVDALREISGVPTTLAPDQQILSQAYNK